METGSATSNWTFIVILLVVLVLWGLVCRAVGLAAKEKGRSRVVWTLITCIPLGPILSPLWLKTMPVSGAKATLGQLVGRTFLALFLLGNLGSGAIQRAVETQTKEKAKEDYGHESQEVTEHYKKMDVTEIVQCLQLTEDMKTLEDFAMLDGESNTWLFSHQTTADKYNDLLASYGSQECESRTYDYTDLSRAMSVIEDANDSFNYSQQNSSQNILEIRRGLAKQAKRINRILPIKVDEATRFDKVELGEGVLLIHHYTLVSYEAAEVSQVDIDNFIRPEAVAEFCSEETSNPLLELGGVMHIYRYHGINGVYIGQVDIGKRDC